MPSTVTRAALLLCLALPLTTLAAPRLSETEPSSAPSAAASVAAQPERPSPFKLTGLQFAAGAGAAVVSVPASLALGVWLGSLSNNLVLAALPSLLAFVALPPLAVTFAAMWVGNLLLPGSMRWSPALWTTMGAQLVMFALAAVLGVHGASVPDAALFTLVEAVVLPGVAVGTMHAFAPKPQSPLAARMPALDPSRPNAARLFAAPVVSCAF